MKVVALISGGKDSTYNLMQCIAAGHEIVALANVTPHLKTEIDSYMYQSVGFEAIDLIARAMNLPLFRRETHGIASQQEKVYVPTTSDEVEDLYLLLEEVQQNVNIEAVAVGAILSDYQRIRVENVCIRLGLIPLAYLWQRNQKELLHEMINCEIDAILIKVATLGLEPSKHLGRTLSSLQPHLHAMEDKYGLNICGEGGEYETLTLDCPLFNSRIVIEESEVILHSNDHIAPAGYLKLNKLGLADKLPALDLNSRLEGLPLKDSDGYVTDQGEDVQDLEESEIDRNLDKPSMNGNGYTKTHPVKINYTTAKSVKGWLWMGGIQGHSQDVGVAMEEALGNLKSILSQHKQTIQDVSLVNMYIADMNDYTCINRIYCDTFKFANPPSRACVQVPLSKESPILLEVFSWQAPEEEPLDPPIERHTMHVQSRSHWAPANIGPYSQTIRIGEFILVAGQIGLIPGNLEIVKGGIKSQCRLALRHVGRLLKAVDVNVNLRDVVQAICYVTDISFIKHARKLWEENTNNAIVDYVVVTNLPKNALTEWHVWAHRHNNQFEYEETGKCIENWSLSIFRRWNYENNIAAIVCHLDNSDDECTFTRDIFIECVDYTIQKLKQGHEDESDFVVSVKIFFPINKDVFADVHSSYLDHIRESISLVYTFVPVHYLESNHTYLSICGVRNE